MTTDVDVLPTVVRADHVPGPPQGRWTYAEYAAIPDDGHRYEIIDGVLYMTPAPNIIHQTTVTRVGGFLLMHVELAGLGRVFVAPVDVDLPLRPTVTVQPDVVVVLNANVGIITPKCIVGAPDLVVEVASPSTTGYDRRGKQDAYARAGVTEYGFADPYARTVELLRLADGAYQSVGVFSGAATLPSVVVPDLPVPVDQFFAP
jgi:Uma2 family endonuclease